MSNLRFTASLLALAAGLSAVVIAILELSRVL
jgi:hypothetical protein